MRIFESTCASAQGAGYVIIRVPATEFADLMDRGHIMFLAERYFQREALLVVAGKGEMHGNLQSCRRLRDFDQRKAKWTQWNMEE